MTCKQCFGDQTMWRRDANGKAIEVPCSCAAMAPITDQDCGASVPPTAPPESVCVTATMRPVFDELKEGDVVWIPAHAWRDMEPGQRILDFQINGVAKTSASVYLTREEYDALPHCPMAIDDRYRPRQFLDEEPQNGQNILVFVDTCWCGVEGYDSNMRHVKNYRWWMPQPPPPPEHP